MSDVAVPGYEEMEPIYDDARGAGAGDAWGDGFGMQVITLPPGWEGTKHRSRRRSGASSDNPQVSTAQPRAGRRRSRSPGWVLRKMETPSWGRVRTVVQAVFGGSRCRKVRVNR